MAQQNVISKCESCKTVSSRKEKLKVMSYFNLCNPIFEYFAKPNLHPHEAAFIFIQPHLFTCCPFTYGYIGLLPGLLRLHPSHFICHSHAVLFYLEPYPSSCCSSFPCNPVLLLRSFFCRPSSCSNIFHTNVALRNKVHFSTLDLMALPTKENTT